MKPILTLFLALLLFSSCGSRLTIGEGETTVEPRETGEFNKIEINVPLDAEIHIKEGAHATVQISGYKNLLKEIETQVVGSVLKIHKQDESLDFDTDKEIVAEITVSSLDELEINGTGDVNVSGNVQSKDFHLTINGAGNINLESITADKLQTEINGAGDVKIKNGTVHAADYSISGAGSINGFGVQCDDVKASIAGAGDIKIIANKTLDGSVSGGGEIRYRGTPTVKSKTVGLGGIEADK
jgi:hypothetical protein